MINIKMILQIFLGIALFLALVPSSAVSADTSPRLDLEADDGTVYRVFDPQGECPPPDCTPGNGVGQDFFVGVIERLSDVPMSTFAVDALAAWEPYENTLACWNPLATTQSMPGSCCFNSVCVRHYLDQEMGMDATANTLALSYYTHIRSMLSLESFDREGLRSDLSTWGSCSGSGCDHLLDTWKDLWDSHADDTTPPTIDFDIPTEDHWYSTDQTLSWNVTDSDSGVDYFKWEWDDSSPDNQVNGSSGSTSLSDAGQGQHTLYVKAWDKAGNDASAHKGWFGYDTADPDAPTIHPGCNASDNQWQNTCRDPDFSWRASDPNGDNGSGIDQYAYEWEASSSGGFSGWVDATSYDPDPITSTNGVEQYELDVQARDVAGNTSSVNTFGLWYDGSAPTVSAVINDGAATTNQTSVRVNLTASDTGSGVSEVRLSHNGLYWDDWQPYADEVAWAIPALDRRELPVYAQVRDGAGNLSTVTGDTIALDLYPPMPHSANYRICDDVVDTGGSVGLASTSYSLVSAIGQPWATGATSNASVSFTEHGGFLANLDGCRPITHTVTDNFDIHQWVIASGGNLRGSASYQLGDTTGEPGASGASAFSSANYTLSSGFWSLNRATDSCPKPLTEVSVTGPVTGIADTLLTFEVSVTPTDATPPVFYTWSPEPESGQGTTKAAYRYDEAGEKSVEVTAENCGGALSASRTVSVLLEPPSGFGVNLNDGALYTNDPQVTVRTWAPEEITEMRLSNDGGYADDGWQSYQENASWEIETYGDYVIPRTVYVWFKDGQNQVYGAHSDDIIYDPVAPTGAISIQSRDGEQATLSLSATDDNSGVAEMRIAFSEGAIGTQAWQPFAGSATVTLSGDVAYAQFRDHAGNPSTVYSSDGGDYEVYLPLVLRNR